MTVLKSLGQKFSNQCLRNKNLLPKKIDSNISRVITLLKTLDISPFVRQTHYFHLVVNEQIPYQILGERESLTLEELHDPYQTAFFWGIRYKSLRLLIQFLKPFLFISIQSKKVGGGIKIYIYYLCGQL